MKKILEKIINENAEHNDSGTCLMVSARELVELLMNALKTNYYLVKIQKREYES